MTYPSTESHTGRLSSAPLLYMRRSESNRRTEEERKKTLGPEGLPLDGVCVQQEDGDTNPGKSFPIGGDWVMHPIATPRFICRKL